MGIIAGLVGLAGMLFWLMAFVGLLFPSLFKDKKTGEVPKRLHLFLGGLVAGVIAFVITGVMMPTSETPADEPAAADKPVVVSKPVTAESAPVEKPAPRKEKDFPFTAEEFRERYNKFALQVDKKFVIGKIDIQKGEVNDTFTLSLGEGIGMVGTVNKKDGLLKGLILILAGENDGLTPMMVFLSVAHAVTDGAPKEEISAAVLDMVQKAAEGVEKGVSLKRKVGSAEYSMTANRITGLMLAISPLDGNDAVAGKSDASEVEKSASAQKETSTGKANAASTEKLNGCAPDDLQCLGDNATVAAGLRCDDPIEARAKYAVRWTDGLFEPKFSRFRWTNKKGGGLTMIGDKVEFQNGFGAWAPMIYECDMTADGKTVLRVRVREGRLPK
jgi:hypothetical protein